jgi:hypothetical protein
MRQNYNPKLPLFFLFSQTSFRSYSGFSSIKNGYDYLVALLKKVKKGFIFEKDSQNKVFLSNTLKTVMCICKFYYYIIITSVFLQFLERVLILGVSFSLTNSRSHRGYSFD